MRVTLYNQHLAHRLGTELISLLERPGWTRFDFAVAWARRSGTRRLLPALESFLEAGGVMRCTVGIDLENTSKEALEVLLTLTGHGQSEIFVCHNELAETTFHPKLYLLTSPPEATLIIGSNNLTGGGLYSNTEVAVQIDAAPTHPIIRHAQSILAVWRDIGKPVIRRLDRTLVDEMVARGYIKRERELEGRRAAARRNSRARRRLFGTEPVAAAPRIGPTRQPPAVDGAVLLMRLRRASPTSRRTQVQIPIRVREHPFFRGVNSVQSGDSGARRRFRVAHARGRRNTIKLEIPEINTFSDPVVRFERRGATVHYTAYDASSEEGRQIMAALQGGRNARANPTILTVPRTPQSSTWYRFI